MYIQKKVLFKICLLLKIFTCIFFPLPDSLKAPTFVAFQIFVLFSYWDWKSAPKKSEVGITSIFWKGRFLFFLILFLGCLSMEFFLVFFKIYFIFNLYKKVRCLFTGGAVGDGLSWRCGGEREGGDFKKIFYQTAMDSCFWGVWFDCQLGWGDSAGGDPQRGQFLQEKSLEVLGEALECGV